MCAVVGMPTQSGSKPAKSNLRAQSPDLSHICMLISSNLRLIVVRPPCSETMHDERAATLSLKF